MDANILKNIISSDTISSKVEPLSEVDILEFPPTETVLIDRLSKTFTRLLSYKVSQEAYQRYSVRIHLIETLRDWSRIKGDVGNLSIFIDSERSCNLLICLLKKYLTPTILSNCDNIDHLIQLAKVILNSIEKNRLFMQHFVRVIDRIISLPQTEKSEHFLQHVIQKSDELKLDSLIVETIYTSQKSKFIEKPFTDCFVAYCSNRNKTEQLKRMDLLFEKMIDSPSLFQLVSNQLKDMFVMTEYSQEAQDFIQIVLEKIQTHCDKYHKDTLDLYPTNLQFCVILLRIKPSYYNGDSRHRAVESLKQICLKNNNDALILISHFPAWLPVYQEFFDNLDVLLETQNSDIQSDEDEITD